MGCGRVGASLGVQLLEMGHTVAIIDRDADAFRRLPENFAGQLVTGVGFDKEVLITAGIKEAQGFVAVSSGDNSNIIASRVVRDNFQIENVVTRIYDSSRADVYERLGIATVPTVKWTSQQIMSKLIPSGPHLEYHDAANQMSLFTADLHDSWLGKTCATITATVPASLAYLVRNSKAFIPTSDTVVQDGDKIFLIAPAKETLAIQRILNHPFKADSL